MLMQTRTVESKIVLMIYLDKQNSKKGVVIANAIYA